ncbi:MAG TPA: response regulator [Bryobacteraceae bacterium]|nr:response regulator [Bryobacteraceae bacterium]
MYPLNRTPLHSSVFALALTAVALLVSLVIRPYLEPDVFLLFIAAVWLSAWYSGRTGGLLATGASALAALYFLLVPNFSFAIQSWEVFFRLLAFVAMSLLITWVTASWRQSRVLLASTLSSIGEAVLATDTLGRITFLNSVAETLTGWPAKEARGKNISEVLRLIDEVTHNEVENPLVRSLRERVVSSAREHTLLVSRSGAEIPIEHSAAPVRDHSGVMRGGILVFRDISQRRHLEQQVTHAQKMDAVGRLAGGVAGDFNNVLTVISGYAELLRSDVPATSSLRRFVDEIIYASERAATLTRHLLAFSRGPSAEPSVLDVNSVISAMTPMLRRLLGQNIELILLTGTGLGGVKADPAQLEQVIVNLANNARDAMPEGGKLVIETANTEFDESGARNLGVKPGPYVMLAVSDTGVGMNPEVRSRLFEPFFTTKAPGQGSGLGLATVYGAVRQSDGQVSVYSQPGCGTIFEIYLPRVAAKVVDPAGRKSSKGSETILLVDDEEGVRKLVSAVLKTNGYDVLEASNAAQAVAAYEKNSHKVDMLLCDIVMPQMNGFELADQLTGLTPSLKILLMSGYRDNAAVANGVNPPRAFLHKPFTPDALLAKVREVLDAEIA